MPNLSNIAVPVICSACRAVLIVMVRSNLKDLNVRGLMYNYLLLAYESIVFAFYFALNNYSVTLDREQMLICFVVGIVVTGIVWVLPNVVYFYRRKDLFEQ